MMPLEPTPHRLPDLPVAPKRIALIANPKAGAGKALAELQIACESLWGYVLDILLFESASQLDRALEQLTPATHRAVVVMGGDGTLNRCLPVVVSRGIPVRIFPLGTANDLAREQGVDANWEVTQSALDRLQIQRLDLLEVNGIPFATVAGIGIGSTLTEEFNRLRLQPDHLLSRIQSALAKQVASNIYTWLAAKTILFNLQKPQKVSIIGDTFQEDLQACAIMICNQGALGGDLMVAPKLDQTDGRFNVLVVPRTTRLGILSALLSLKKGVLPDDLIVFSTTRLKVTHLEGMPMQVFGDGETLASAPELQFGIHPKKLQLITSPHGLDAPKTPNQRGLS